MKLFFCSLMIISFSALGIETKEFDGSQIKKLEISNPKGEVLISSLKSAKKITVSIEKLEFDKKCKFVLSPSMGILKVAVEHENALFDKANCVSKIKISVPSKELDIDASTGTASIKIEDIDGRIDFKTATGPVDIKGDFLKNINGKTATGTMRISYNHCRERADIDLVTATGDAEIYLPSTCKIRVSHKSATGDLFNELGESENYQVLINAKSAGGSLKIRRLGK